MITTTQSPPQDRHVNPDPLPGHHSELLPADARIPRIPPGFLTLPEPGPAYLDRRLGYFGHSRFVVFYYEPRGGDVIWKDGKSCGFATGAWQIFLDDLASLAQRYQVDLGGHERPGTHALVIDRTERSAWFALRHSAEEFMVVTCGYPAGPDTCLLHPPRRKKGKMN